MISLFLSFLMCFDFTFLPERMAHILSGNRKKGASERVSRKALGVNTPILKHHTDNLKVSPVL